MTLSSKQIREYRAIGHRLNPVVMIASGGLSENVNAEIKRALGDHELIKIKLSVGEREVKQTLIEEICASQGAELVQVIGNMALIYRAAKKPNPRLSNLLRYRNESD